MFFSHLYLIHFEVSTLWILCTCIIWGNDEKFDIFWVKHIWRTLLNQISLFLQFCIVAHKLHTSPDVLERESYSDVKRDEVRVFLTSSCMSAVFSSVLHYMAKMTYLVGQRRDLKVFTCVCLLSAGVCRRFWSLPRHVGRRRTLGDLFSTGFGQGGEHSTYPITLLWRWSHPRMHVCPLHAVHVLQPVRLLEPPLHHSGNCNTGAIFLKPYFHFTFNFWFAK